MEYQRHYDSLIDKAKNRVLKRYSETHHIIPKCLGGDDSKDNLVDLTAREHFVAHLLLAKIHGGVLWVALNLFDVNNSHQYEWVRKQVSKAMSGKGNPMHGKSAWAKYSKEEKRKSFNKTARSLGSKPFLVWKAIAIKPSSYKGLGFYEKGSFVGEFLSKNDCEKRLNVRRQRIVKCLNGKSPQSGGFIFEYKT